MKKIILYIGFIILSGSMFSQAGRTNYFLDKYTHNHNFNPAMSPAWGYFYIPGTGVHQIGLESNLKLSQFLFPLDDGKLGTFLHPDVGTDEFLSKLHKRNKMNAEVIANILSFGFYSKDKFFSFDVAVKSNVFFNIPYDFFAFAKKGMESSSTSYNFKNMSIGADAYVEAALGYAQDINSNWRVGGKLKILCGAANALLEIQNMEINLSEDQWLINSKNQLTILGNGVSFEKDSAGIINGIAFDEDKIGVGGWGAGIDLGAVYTFDEFSPLANFKVSLGVTDLGFIRYKANNVLKAETQGQVVFDGFNGIGISDSGTVNNIDDLLDQLQDDLFDMIEPREVAGSTTNSFLKAKVNLGVEYSFLNDKMSVGLLSTTRFGLPGVTSELTLSVNARPMKWLAAAVSTSFLHGLNSIGFVLNITPKYGFNLFLGTDHVFFEVTPQYIPVNMARTNFFFGLSVPLGGNRAPKYRADYTQHLIEFIDEE